MAYLGGYRQTMKEKREKVEKCLRPLSGINMGFKWQCRCGGMTYVKYRGKFYCQKCGRRIIAPDIKTVGRMNTFREQFLNGGNERE